MAYGLSNGHVTDDVTWHPKVLWGSTVSAILATAWLLVYLSPAAVRVQVCVALRRRGGGAIYGRSLYAVYLYVREREVLIMSLQPAQRSLSNRWGWISVIQPTHTDS